MNWEFYTKCLQSILISKLTPDIFQPNGIFPDIHVNAQTSQSVVYINDKNKKNHQTF